MITLVALPLGLAFIMVSLGLGLIPDDFRRVVQRPRGVAIGMLPVAARVLVITLLPLGIGMLLRNRRSEWAVRNEPIFKRVSIGLFIVIVASAIASEWGRVTGYLGDVIVAVVLLNVAAMTISFLLARAARLNEASATAIALELGLHNATLAIAVGSAVSSEMTVPAAV